MNKGELQTQNKWPKKLPELTEEQIRIKNEWMKYWHEVLPKKYGLIESFNQKFPLRAYKFLDNNRRFCTLEIGAGLGEHISYENLNNQQYFALELRENMAEVLRQKFPTVRTYVGDIQQKTNFEDAFFDRIIAVHVLEHLPDLPNALKEIHRLLKNDGCFSVVIPCEGALAYKFARYISTRRIFEKKFNMQYDWLMKTEHVNFPGEIFEEIRKYFVIQERSFFPLAVPWECCNLCIGVSLSKI